MLRLIFLTENQAHQRTVLIRDVGKNAETYSFPNFMTENKIDYFNKKSPEIFRNLVENYGYELADLKTNERNGMKCSAHHIYCNEKKALKIIIKQEPYYTDYGFSFFIHKIGTKEYNILYNVEAEYQDDENRFLQKAYTDLFSTPETLDLISGKYSKELGYIPFRIK